MAKTKSSDILSGLISIFHNMNYKLSNTYVFNWESDFFCISNAGYCYEIEIKISRSDFLADFKKSTRSGMNKHEFICSSDNHYKANKFAFACPENLIKIEDLPDIRYGLYYIGVGYGTKVIREPKFIHKEKHLNQLNFVTTLMNKFYYRNIDLMFENNLRLSDLRFGQKRLNDRRY